jgi:hypothetical protein
MWLGLWLQDVRKFEAVVECVVSAAKVTRVDVTQDAVISASFDGIVREWSFDRGAARS